MARTDQASCAADRFLLCDQVSKHRFIWRPSPGAVGPASRLTAALCWCSFGRPVEPVSGPRTCSSTEL